MIDIFENNHNDILVEIDNKAINAGSLVLCKDSIELITTFFTKESCHTYLLIADKFKDMVIGILPDLMFEKTLFMGILDNVNSNLYVVNDNKYHFTARKYQIYV